jgi:DNA repair ATPase RecN
MQRQLLEKRLQNAKNSIGNATGSNIIERCDRYLILLNKLRYELYKLRRDFEIDHHSISLLKRREIEKLRKQFRTELMNIIQELNQTTVLLNNLTDSSSYEVVETLNKQKYLGHNNWEFADDKFTFCGCPASEQMEFQTAMNIAIRLRCDEFDGEKHHKH